MEAPCCLGWLLCRDSRSGRRPLQVCAKPVSPFVPPIINLSMQRFLNMIFCKILLINQDPVGSSLYLTKH